MTIQTLYYQAKSTVVIQLTREGGIYALKSNSEKLIPLFFSPQYMKVDSFLFLSLRVLELSERMQITSVLTTCL